MPGVIRSELSLITGPSREPIDLDQAKKHTRFSSTSEDTLFDSWISAARDYFEGQTGRQLMDAVWEYWLDCFPGQREIEIPCPPLREVLSVTYADDAGTDQVMDVDDYRVIAPSGPRCRRGRVALVSGATWPATAAQAGAVRIRFRAGYGTTPGAVPELTRTALYLLVAHFHQFRGPASATQGREAVAAVPLSLREFVLSFKSRPELLPRAA